MKFGYDGPFTATPRGLIPATITAGNVADDPTDSTCSLTSPNGQKIQSRAGRHDVRPLLAVRRGRRAGADIDLCVFSGATQVGGSGRAPRPRK